MTRRPVALALALGAVAGCFRAGGSPIGIPMRAVSQFEAEWSSYRVLSGRKALAVAGDLDGVYVSGFTYAYPLQDLANDEALDQCEQRRVDRRIEEPCRLYAIGDERVEDIESGESTP